MFSAIKLMLLIPVFFVVLGFVNFILDIFWGDDFEKKN